MAEKTKPSPVEVAKIQSDYLRGTIAEELVDGKPNFGKASIALLKHHGMYEQDDRDLRKQTKQKHYSFMIRTRIPGGKLTPEQLLAELDLCDELGNTTLRATTRQGLQLHGILKQNIKAVMRRINEVQLTTLAACGDVERNVMCTPAPFVGPIPQQLQELTDALAEHLRPRTNAYYEVWLKDEETGEEELVGGQTEPTEVAPTDFEPIYGPTYLPRKFKTAVAAPEDNCVDIYSNDLGFLAVHDGTTIEGYNVLVGGGMGMTPSAKKTFPALAKELCFIRPEQALAVSEAIVKVQRDNGNRSDRKIARLKYVIANWGIEKFKAEVEKYYGQPLDAPRPIQVSAVEDHLGWHAQGDGKFFYGLYIENGRIKDEGTFRLKTALRQLVARFPVRMRITPHQNLLFCDLEAGAHQTVLSILREHGVKPSEEYTALRRLSMACPALPTCGLAVTESERAMPEIMDQIEHELSELGLGDEIFTIHMTGCPNGCARPYNCDIGLVGKTLGKYTVLIGGNTLGNRLNWVYRDLVPAESVGASLRELFTRFKAERRLGESLGDFSDRIGPAALGAEAPSDIEDNPDD